MKRTIQLCCLSPCSFTHTHTHTHTHVFMYTQPYAATNWPLSFTFHKCRQPQPRHGTCQCWWVSWQRQKLHAFSRSELNITGQHYLSGSWSPTSRCPVPKQQQSATHTQWPPALWGHRRGRKPWGIRTTNPLLGEKQLASFLLKPRILTRNYSEKH